LINEYGTNANLRLIYADFSYCSFSLPEIIILPTDKISDNPSMEKPSTSSSTKGEVNILLLGESGVGKSTFINAFIQYLAFKTLEEAESKEPIVLIPVSFLMTTGDNFEEKKINFGTADNFNNEDFNHPGESVTQHCKSYVFALNKLDGQKLRIIDTPGFGDTRGIDQDDANMQHILKYINNLTHLNAICFLFKPNASRLNNFFPICLTQLLDLLGPDARQNIIFCFTNARPTFYTPGDTAPLLKAMLSNFSIGDIPFKKENTFCFDSESFRYLVALKNGINFDELDRKEYEMSWSTSLKESNRLVSYVTTELQTYSSHKQRQSAKNAQIQITQMIRPMLEAMRNILRHIVMTDMKILDKSVKLKPTAIHRPASRCASCNLITIQMGSFLLAEDDPHEMLHHCHQCQCASSLHNSIDYILQYELLARSSDYDRNQMDRLVRQLHSTSNEFAYFLMHVARLMKSDPFLMGLTNIIIEEYNLCQVQKPNMLNSKLLEYLRNLQDEYEDNMYKMNGNEKGINMPSIYEQIQKIRAQPEVREQLNAVEESQQILMKEYEYVVPEHLFT
jgi:ribosome biogenesis GTPase A